MSHIINGTFCSGDMSQAFAEKVMARQDVYGLTQKIAGHMYQGVRDKGDNSHDSTIWNHIRRVEDLTDRFFKGRVSDAALIYFRAMAVGHELFDIKDPSKTRQLFTIDEALAHGLPEEFVMDLHALGVKPGERFLDYAQRLSCRPRAALWKVAADLVENRSVHRQSVPEHEQTQKFKDKKNYLYEMVDLYLTATLLGQIPAGSSLPAFIMRDKMVPARLKDEGVLLRNSSDQMSYPAAAPAWWIKRLLHEWQRPGMLHAVLSAK